MKSGKVGVQRKELYLDFKQWLREKETRVLYAKNHIISRWFPPKKIRPIYRPNEYTHCKDEILGSAGKLVTDCSYHLSITAALARIYFAYSSQAITPLTLCVSSPFLYSSTDTTYRYCIMKLGTLARVLVVRSDNPFIWSSEWKKCSPPSNTNLQLVYPQITPCFHSPYTCFLFTTQSAALRVYIWAPLSIFPVLDHYQKD